MRPIFAQRYLTRLPFTKMLAFLQGMRYNCFVEIHPGGVLAEMIGLGTIINAGCILIGGVCGLLFGRRLPQRFQRTLMSATGVAVLFLGIGGAMEKMLHILEGKLVVGGAMMMILSLTLGAVLGQLLDLEGKLERFGNYLKQKSGSGDDANFVNGFLTASFTVCVGAMAVVGAIQDGIGGDYRVLLAKGILDAIIIMIMTSSLGKGCIFSAIPVVIFQGGVTLLARAIGALLNQAALDNLSCVGSILIFCVGVNLLWDTKIKVANLLPAVFLAAIWGLLA